MDWQIILALKVYLKNILMRKPFYFLLLLHTSIEESNWKLLMDTYRERVVEGLM